MSESLSLSSSLARRNRPLFFAGAALGEGGGSTAFARRAPNWNSGSMLISLVLAFFDGHADSTDTAGAGADTARQARQYVRQAPGAWTEWPGPNLALQAEPSWG